MLAYGGLNVAKVLILLALTATGLGAVFGWALRATVRQMRGIATRSHLCDRSRSRRLSAPAARPKSLPVMVDRLGVLRHSAGAVRTPARSATAGGSATLVA